MSRKIVKKASNKVRRKQPVYGIQVLAGGTLGCMFRLFKKNKEKYRQQFAILKQMTVTDKENANIPVQQRARDKGGLYIIKPEFLPTLQNLDKEITDEFVAAEKHGRNIIKVILKFIV